MASKPIKIEITGDSSKFQKELDKTSGSLAKFGKAAALGFAALGAVAVGAGVALFNVGQDFDTMRNNIIKGTGATGEALDELFESAKTVMSNVPESGEIVSNTLADVNTFFGVTGDELEELTEGMLDFARVTEVDVSSAVGAVDAALTQFGLTTEDADEAMGDFLRISQATGVPMEKLLTQMETFGPLFANAGFSLEETTALFGQLEQAGVNVTRVGPALNKFFRDTAEAGEDPREALEAVQQAMLDATTESEALNIATEAFGAEGAQRMTTAIRTGAVDLEGLNELMGEGAGLVGEQAEATETFSDKWNTFKNKVLVKLEPLATKLFDKITEGMSWVESDGIPAIEELVEKFQKFADWIRDHKDLVIGTLIAIGSVIGTILVAAFVSWAIAAGTAAVATIVALAPLIAIGLAVAAVAVLIWKLWKDWDKIWAQIRDLTKRVTDWIKKKISDAWNSVISKFQEMKNKAVLIFNSMKDTLIQKAKDLVKDVVNWITGLPQKVKDLGSKFLAAGKAVGGKIIEGIKSGLTSAVGFVGDVASGLWKAVRNAVNTNVVDRINNAIPDSIPLKGLPDINLPNNPVPRLFQGVTDFGGGVALVGEQGRELVTLPEGANVLTNENTERVMGGGMKSQTINMNVQTNADPHEIARELAWQVRRG